MSRGFYKAIVLARRDVSPGMVRVTFGGPGLSGFVSTGIGDEYLRLFFADAETGALVLPEIDEAGRWTYPEGARPSHTAPYTVRRHDAAAGTIDIDFVVHEGGIASDWAQLAVPGDEMVLTASRGLYAAPADLSWQLLACDATGLPAVARLLEQTPTHVASRVVVEIAEPRHRIDLKRGPRTEIIWIEGSGNGVAPSRLPEIVRTAKLPSGSGYIWVAGEQKAVRPIRRFLRHELGLPGERYKVVAYWTEKAADWRAGWDGLAPTVKAQIDAAWASERDPEEVRDEVDATLERHGL